MLRVDFVTLFPEMVRPSLEHSILGRAARAGHVAFRTANPRDFCHDRHLKVDDRPFGGEPGMVIRAEPVARAVEWLLRDRGLWKPLQNPRTAIVLTAPTGRTFDQAAARELSGYDRIVFLCGHNEGIDHRVEEELCTHVFSVGDYVLTNGEMPALTMADAVVRLAPGVLGKRGFSGGGLVFRRAPERAELHAAGRLARAGGSGGVERRRPPRDRQVAAAGGFAAYARPAARSPRAGEVGEAGRGCLKGDVDFC